MSKAGMKPVAAAVMFLTAAFGAASVARAGLDEEVGSILSGKGFSGVQTGVYIARLDTEGAHAVMAKNAGTPLTPASNMKVLTTSAALDRLGADFKYRTLLVQH